MCTFIHFPHPAFCFSSGEGRGDTSPWSTRNASRFSATSDISAGSTRDKPVGDVITPSGPWWTSGPLPVGVPSRTRLANFSWDILVTWPNHRSYNFYSYKWTDIRGSTNFTAAHFIAKYHVVNSSQKSHLFGLYLRWHSFSH